MTTHPSRGSTGYKCAMPIDPRVLTIRVAEASDVEAIAALRALWSDAPAADPEFEDRMSAWLAADGERRTVWLAVLVEQPVGMASMFEYRRMPRPGRPDSRWGYVSNMFVREEHRNAGIGSALLTAVITTAEERGYARLVVSPAHAALSFYRRAGFIVPDEGAGPDQLLVRALGRRPPPST
jgi:GNAT superfamily N-acetyltransferase